MAYLVYRFGWRELLSVLSAASPAWLMLVVALVAAGYLLRAWKWRVALGPGRRAVELFFLAKSAGNWTPGRVGELAPLLLGEHRNARVAAWILADRVIEIWLTVGLGLMGGLSLALVQPASLILMGVAFVLVSGMGVYVVLRWNPAATLSSSSLLARILKFAHIVRGEILALGLKGPALLLLTVAAKVTDVWAVMALFQAFGHGVNFLLVCAARFAHALVSASPLTPDSTGVPYVAAAALLHERAAIPPATLITALSFEALIIFGMAHMGLMAASAIRSRTPAE
ncbi:MAG: hypothetical protein RLZZ303_2086 [Candidatus Hydrogenedentota bacterium]|jgi:hypothetical protein